MYHHKSATEASDSRPIVLRLPNVENTRRLKLDEFINNPFLHKMWNWFENISLRQLAAVSSRWATESAHNRPPLTT